MAISSISQLFVLEKYLSEGSKRQTNTVSSSERTKIIVMACVPANTGIIAVVQISARITFATLHHSMFFLLCLVCVLAALNGTEAFWPAASHTIGTASNHVPFRLHHESNAQFKFMAGKINPSSSKQDIENGCNKSGRRLAVERMASTGLLLAISAPTNPAAAATARMDVNNALARGEST